MGIENIHNDTTLPDDLKQYHYQCRLIKWFNEKLTHAWHRWDFNRCKQKYWKTKNGILIHHPAYEKPKPFPPLAAFPSLGNVDLFGEQLTDVYDE